MATRKRKTKSTKPTPHCKNVTIKSGANAGKKRKMCFDGKGKITSKAKVDAYFKRQRGGRRKAT